MPRNTKPPPVPQVHPTYVRLLRMLLRALQVDADAVLAKAGLSWQELSTDDRWLRFETIERLVPATLEATGRPWLGLELGSAAQLSSHGPLGYAVTASRDLAQALQAVARFACLRNELFRWEYAPEPGGAVLRAIERYEFGQIRVFLIDVLYATVLRLMAEVIGQRPASVRVDLPFAQPPWRERYEACGTAALRFDRPVMAWHVPDELLATPCLAADAHAFESALRDCEAALAQCSPETLSLRVQTLLHRLGEDQRYPTLVDVAAGLHISPRTLMRKLGSEGTSFQQLLDDERKEQAVWYLRHTAQSMELIAARLGFADTSNFSRTVKRWFGVTPSAMRAGEDRPR